MPVSYGGLTPPRTPAEIYQQKADELARATKHKAIAETNRDRAQDLLRMYYVERMNPRDVNLWELVNVHTHEVLHAYLKRQLESEEINFSMATASHLHALIELNAAGVELGAGVFFTPNGMELQSETISDAAVYALGFSALPVDQQHGTALQDVSDVAVYALGFSSLPVDEQNRLAAEPSQPWHEPMPLQYPLPPLWDEVDREL